MTTLSEVTSAQQEFFSEVYVRLNEIYPDIVFDGFMPSESTPYPFIYLGNTSDRDDTFAKSGCIKELTQTVHVWHSDPRKRGDLSRMMECVKNEICQIERTDTYYFYRKIINSDILTDTSTSTPLMHGVIEVETKYCRR
jgi:hypothetical protein